MSLVARISAIIGDAIVLVVTWVKTAKLYSDARRTGVKAPLAVMLIEDGTIFWDTAGSALLFTDEKSTGTLYFVYALTFHLSMLQSYDA